jgi:low temperature requirement protein LtrA
VAKPVRLPDPEPLETNNVLEATDPDPAERAESSAADEKRVSWAELFFDLVFVFAVTEVSSRLTHDHRGAGLLRSLVLFVPIYWAWVGTSLQANLRDVSKPTLRLGMFGVALSGFFMALAVPYAFESRALLFALAYWAGRLLLGIPLIVRHGLAWTPYSVSMVVTAPLLTVGALLPNHAQLAVWVAAAVLDLSTPTLLRARLTRLHYDPAHLAERFGLFVLIALGESVVTIGTAAQSRGPLQVSTGFAVAVAFALSCALWWVYFQFAADAVRHSLATAKIQLDITRSVLSYGHLSFIAAIIAVAVGMRAAVSPASTLGWSGAGFLYGGTALFLATFGYTRWRMFRLLSITRLVAAAVAVVLLPVAAVVPSLLGTTILAVTVAVLNVVEYARVERIGWRALLGSET